MARVAYDDNEPQTYLSHIDMIYANLGLGGAATVATITARCEASNDTTDDSVISAIKASNISASHEEAVIAAYKRTGGGAAKGSGDRSKKKQCRYHRQFKDKAYNCAGGDCADKAKLAKPPDKKSSGSY